MSNRVELYREIKRLNAEVLKLKLGGAVANKDLHAVFNHARYNAHTEYAEGMYDAMHMLGFDPA